MKTTLRHIVLMLACVFCAAACGEAPAGQREELDAGAFRQHFENQNACVAFVDQIVRLAAGKMSDLSSIGEMRQWIESHPTDMFAILAKRVQNATRAEGRLDPRKEKDQLFVTSKIVASMQSLQGFETSECGPNVRDIFMETLYNGLGGGDASVLTQLRRLGVNEPTEQKWVLLVALFVNSIVTITN